MTAIINTFSNLLALKEGRVDARKDARAVQEVIERVQQQLAKINDGENLKTGERHYGRD